jgi:hypothetical protein
MRIQVAVFRIAANRDGAKNPGIARAVQLDDPTDRIAVNFQGNRRLHRRMVSALELLWSRMTRSNPTARFQTL